MQIATASTPRLSNPNPPKQTPAKTKSKIFKKLTPHIIVKLIRSGVKLNAIAMTHNTTIAAVSNQLKSAGLTYKEIRSQAVEDFVLSNVKEIQEGKTTIAQITKDSPWPAKQINNAFSKLGSKNKPIKIPINILEDIIEKLSRGEKYKTIIKNYDYKFHELRNAVQKFAGKKIIEIRGWTDKQKQTVELLNKGMSLSQIGKEMGCSRQCVSLTLQKLGIPVPYIKEIKVRHSEVIGMLKGGEYIQDVAEKTGLSCSAISQIGSKNKIKITRKPCRQRLPNPNKEKLINDVRSGIGRPTALAAKYDTTVQTACRWCREAGL